MVWFLAAVGLVVATRSRREEVCPATEYRVGWRTSYVRFTESNTLERCAPARLMGSDGSQQLSRTLKSPIAIAVAAGS